MELKSKIRIAALGALALCRPAFAIETQVLTGVYYYPSDAEKLMRAQTENGEDGLKFVAPRPAREVARDYADEELRNGNICLSQLRHDLRTSLKNWRVRDLCEKVFHDPLEHALLDAGREKLHPDHVECSADAEAREKGGKISLDLSFHGQLVFKDRAPQKLRNVGIGGELTRWDLPAFSDSLGETEGTWKDALKLGACSADEKALSKFWDRVHRRADAQREFAQCRDGIAKDAEKVARIQRQLTDYVPEEWVRERAGKNYDELLAAPSADEPANLSECKQAHGDLAKQLAQVRELSSSIASKYDVPALDNSHAPGRSPASVTEDEED